MRLPSDFYDEDEAWGGEIDTPEETEECPHDSTQDGVCRQCGEYVEMW